MIEDARPAPPFLIIPGLGNSGPGHWQSVWQGELATARRVEQANWDAPVRADWIASLRAAIRQFPGAIVIAHSLGCIAVAHLAVEDRTLPVHGALMVAPADVERPAAPDEIRPFAPVPLTRLSFPSIVVASRNDPFVSRERAALFASAWGSELVDIGAAGHVNLDAGFGPWPEGRALLDRLVARVGVN
ncbi:MAG: RBBP9/YdeN family alpha/beta hydrolase [Gemmatimonas sp.]